MNPAGVIRRKRAQALEDRVGPRVRLLFVGINPGRRSAAIGHHFAGYSNRFWRLLFESGLVPAPMRAEDDVRLPEWQFGITNLIPRMTPGIDTLRPAEYTAGLRALRRKVRRWRPDVVAFLGITLYRAIDRPDVPRGQAIAAGLQAGEFEGAKVFVLPNPSGRNANFTYGEMLEQFRGLRAFLNEPRASRASPTARRPSVRRG